MSSTRRPFITARRMRAAFEMIYSELASRIAVLARRFPDQEEAGGEMMASAWVNFRSVARRRGVFIHPGLLAWVSCVRLRAGRLMAGSSVQDVHAPAAQALGRARLFHLSLLSSSKRRQVISDSTVEHIVTALTTDEREQPCIRAATRLDWAAFMHTLPNRLRRILRGLVVGDSKGLIARRLGISNGRLSQLLDVLAQEITTFFTPELLPTWCAA